MSTSPTPETAPLSTTAGLGSRQREAFGRDGFLVVRGLADPGLCRQLRDLSSDLLAREAGPVEYESELGYPGAPSDREAAGGETIRRLKQVIGRDPLFTAWAADSDLLDCLHGLLGPDLILPLAHHNCVMSKQPRHSSDTHWHQDIRYWSFRRPELVSTWLALGEESPENGALELIPGSHRLDFNADRLDDDLFFRDDLPENQEVIGERQRIPLSAGDVLFFHCRLLHAAGRNRSDRVKLSVVFTYRPADNPPLPGSRSASQPELLLPAGRST